MYRMFGDFVYKVDTRENMDFDNLNDLRTKCDSPFNVDKETQKKADDLISLLQRQIDGHLDNIQETRKKIDVLKRNPEAALVFGYL